MRDIDQADLARGARVEMLVEAIKSDNQARALGLWAGMTRDERSEFGPLIWGLMHPAGGESR